MKNAHIIRRILPKLIGMLTGRQRYFPDFEWSNRSWTHNAFRLWEAVFGRAYGKNGVGDTIRAEVSVSMWEEDGKVMTSYQFHSTEAIVAHVEGMIRGMVPKLIPVKVFIPQLSPAGMLPGFPIMRSPYLFAIAYDNSGGTTFGAQPRTVSITVSGSNRLMVFHQSAISDPGSTMPTYNSVSATEIARGTFPGSGRTGTVLSRLIAPATGSNTASFPSSGSQLLGQAASYTGVDQTNPIDSNGTTSATSTTITGTTTVVGSNCWLVTASSDSSGSSYSNGTGTLRVQSANGAVLFDSAGTVGTGSQSKTVNVANAAWQAITASIAPVSATQYDQSVIATTSVTGVVTKGLSKTLVATTTVSASVLKQLTRTLIATTAVTASMVKQMAKALTASVVVTGILTATKVTLKTLTATVSVTASIAKIPGKVLSGTAAVTANLAKTATLTRTLQATAAVTGVVLKGLSKTLTATSAVSAVLTKVPGKLLQASAAITATLDKTQAKILTATAAVTASMTAGRAVIMTAAVATTATLEKTVGKLLAVTLSITAKVLAPFWRTKYPSHGDEDDYQIKYPHD